MSCAHAGALTDILEVFTGLEADSPPRRDADFLSGAGVATDAALARFHLEHAKSAKFDTIAALHGEPHRIKYGVDRNLGLDLGDVGDFRNFVDDIDLDHLCADLQQKAVTNIESETYAVN